MANIGLYHASGYTLTDCDTDDITVGNVREPTEMVTIADYAFEKPHFLKDEMQSYAGRLVQFDFSPQLQTLLAVQPESSLSAYQTVLNQLGVELAPVSFSPDQFWRLLDAANDHGAYNLHIDHPVTGQEKLEDIACALENTNRASENDIAYYYDQARDNQYPVISGPDIRLDGVDGSFSLSQVDDPVEIAPGRGLTAEELTVIGAFLRDNAWVQQTPSKP